MIAKVTRANDYGRLLLIAADCCRVLYLSAKSATCSGAPRSPKRQAVITPGLDSG